MVAEKILTDVLTALGVGIGGDLIARVVLKQHITLPLYLRIPILKTTLKEHYHEYAEKTAITDFWKDNLGKHYGPEHVESKKPALLAQHRAVFEDVVLADFVPRAPGFYYSKELWGPSPFKTRFSDLVKLSSGVERVGPSETEGDHGIKSGVRIVTINKPLQFQAHTNIEEGIPLVLTENVYQRISEMMDKFGSVHVRKIATTLSSIPRIYADRFRLPYHARRVFPTLRSLADISGIDDPLDSPILGHAWIVYSVKGKRRYARYRFWTGVEHHDSSLDRASDEIRRMIPKNAVIETDFDEKKQQFSEAALRPKNIRALLSEVMTKSS